MDLKLALTTFVTVFLAELGDKTQLATLSFAASGSSRWRSSSGRRRRWCWPRALAVLVGEGLAPARLASDVERVAGRAVLRRRRLGALVDALTA